MEIQLETDKVILRHVRQTDLHDIFEYAVDQETGPRAGWPPHKTIEDTKAILNNWLKKDATEEVFAIVYKENNKMIGTVGITLLNNHEKDQKNLVVKEVLAQGKIAYEIGTTLAKAYWNKGISTNTLKVMLEHLFKDRNADVVIVCHYEQNKPSERVQIKNGLKQIYAYERDKAWWNTDCKTMIVRVKTKEEWLKEKEKE